MSLWDAAVWDPRPAAVVERRRLLELLRGLTEAEWLTTTAVPRWRVKDLALHVLDDDLTWLSYQRDGDLSVRIDMSDRTTFVERLAAKNQRWVDAAQTMSRQVVIDLLTWTGGELEQLHAGQDLRADGWVSWAADGPVPYWFNLAQELTERWVHQHQIRLAVGRVGEHLDLLPDVLRTFVWAFPHQLQVAAPIGSQIELVITHVGGWVLTAGADGWHLSDGPAAMSGLARLELSADAAWRLLTGADLPATGVSSEGSSAAIAALLRVRSIIV